MVAFGDGGNDVEMLKRAGTGIAMDNAPEAVKEISDGTTGSNNSERQTIENYQAAVEIQLGRFVERLEVESAGATLLSPSEISSRSNGGYMMFSALIAFKQPVSYIRARELAEQLFFAVGLNSIADRGDNIFSMILPTEDL